MAFLSILSWHNLSNLIPVIVIEVFYEFRVLDNKGEESILEQMCFIVFPLGKCSQRLCWILLLLEKLVEDFHCLLIGYDSFSIELVFAVLKPYHIIKVTMPSISSLSGFLLLPLTMSDSSSRWWHLNVQVIFS